MPRPHPPRVWLLRHAESADPTVFHGADSDVGLSPLGHRQAAAVGDHFRGQGVTAVVSSGMRRAVLTAAPIAAACGVPHLVEPELYERRIGPLLSGQPFDAAGGAWPETVRRWEAGDLDYTTPGAESYTDLRARLMPAWGRVAAAHRGGRVVVVAHGIVCKVLLLTLLDGYGPADWTRLGRMPNVAVTELEPTPAGWRVAGLLAVPPGVLALTGGPTTEVTLPPPA